MSVLRFLIEEDVPAEAIASVEACYEGLARFDGLASSVDRAAAGGFVADRIGYAFVAGYRAALSRLDASLGRASFCATEEGGVHPRAMRTSLTPSGDAFVLDGEKTFATLASAADTLLVVASRGERDGRNWLQIARIPAKRDGVTIRDRDPIAFAPEIPHARVSLHGVRVAPSELLEGDGHARYVKPFRTIEDVHVIAAFLGHVVRVVRAHHEPPELAERALASIAALRALAEDDPKGRGVHLALAGILAVARETASAIRLEGAGEAERSRWQRDLPLLLVAEKARQLRREAAWDPKDRRPSAP